MPAAKRSRATYEDAGVGTTEWSTARKRAYMAQKNLNVRYPYKNYGRAFYQRGTPDNIQRFGETYRSANDEQKALRKQVGYYGRGKYSLGTAWRSIVGKKNGRAIRDALVGKALTKINGMGMYTGHGMYSNNLVDIGAATNPEAVIQGTGDETGSIIIRHREYLTDVYGPAAGTAFANQTYALNPGLQGTFNWLSQIAVNYEEYEFQQIIFTYRSTTTDIGSSTTGQCGTVVMATNYNAAAKPFADKGVMMEYAHAHSCKTTESMVHGVECDPNKVALSKVMYIRNAAIASGQDIKTYDHGLFQIAICNSPAGFANQTIGELWVEYTVRLSKPRLFASRGLDTEQDLWLARRIQSGGAANANDPFNVPLYPSSQNGIGCVLDRPSTGQLRITFPAGFAGACRVVIAIQAVSPAAWNSQMYSWVYNSKSGNVTQLYDLQGAQGAGKFLISLFS